MKLHGEILVQYGPNFYNMVFSLQIDKINAPSQLEFLKKSQGKKSPIVWISFAHVSPPYPVFREHGRDYARCFHLGHLPQGGFDHPYQEQTHTHYFSTTSVGQIHLNVSFGILDQYRF